MPWRRLAITSAAVLIVLLILAYGFRRDPRFIPSPLLGRQAPSFSLTLFDGSSLRLEDLRGKTVFVNFWASWCLPCRAEAEALEAAWQDARDAGVVFIGVNIQDSEREARAFLEEFRATYPNGRDAAGRIAVDYGVWGIPETFFIGPEGRITYKHVGALEPALISAKLNEARENVVSASEGQGSHLSIR
jgi:cytochrome c biogenesis protein CcmG/thiol:disulfide interchange protein DsbE